MDHIIGSPVFGSSLGSVIGSLQTSHLSGGTEQLSMDHLSQTWLCLYKSREEKDLSDVQTFFLNIFKDFQTLSAKNYNNLMKV